MDQQPKGPIAQFCLVIGIKISRLDDCRHDLVHRLYLVCEVCLHHSGKVTRDLRVFHGYSSPSHFHTVLFCNGTAYRHLFQVMKNKNYYF